MKTTNQVSRDNRASLNRRQFFLSAGYLGRRLYLLLAATTLGVTIATAANKVGIVTSHSEGLHGYIGFGHEKLPKLRFPVDAEGRAYLVQDVTYYSKAALYDALKSWRDGGIACSGRFGEKGAFRPRLNTHTTQYDQAGKKLVGVERAFDTRVFEGNVWGLQWFSNNIVAKGLFPQYYKHVGEERVAVPAADVPAETKLTTQVFQLGEMGVPYTSHGDGLRSHRDAPAESTLTPLPRAA